VKAREPIGEREHTTAWPEGVEGHERERVKEPALIRAPRGLVGEITGHKEMRVDGRRRKKKVNMWGRKWTKT
jgi:hypothetical protein